MNLGVVLVLWGLFFNNPDSLIRGIYINPYRAWSKEYLNDIFTKADSGLINTIVVDFKSDYGFLTYPSSIECALSLKAVKRYLDVEHLLTQARRHNLKVVARIVCFRDNYLAFYKDWGIKDDKGKVWLDKKGLAWTNPYHPEVRAYLLEVAQEVVKLGITSIAFDYIRFPTDGDLGRIRLTHVQGSRYTPILDFLKQGQKKFGKDIEIGTCVFGYATWFNMKSEGQDIEAIGTYVDVLYPMLYPSHFAWSFKRAENDYWRNYWIYFDSVREAFTRLSPHVKVVPFVQGFDLMAAQFDGDYIFAQIHGALSADADGFIIWHAGGKYTTSWAPLLWARNSILRQSALKNLSSRTREEGRRYQDIILEKLLIQGRIPVKNLTMDLLYSPIDSLPLLKNQKDSSDPILP